MLVDYSIVPTYVTDFEFFIAYVEILVLANPCAMKGTGTYGDFARMGTHILYG